MGINVLVIEDSLTVRKRLVEIINAHADLTLVGEADDGQRGLELCQQLRPDVVTMDLMLPTVNGLAATEHIMAYCPTPILIVSSAFNRGELFNTYDALAAGAVDVLEKPKGDESDDEWEQRFVATLKVVARIRVITHPRLRLRSLARAATGRPPAPASLATPPAATVVGIGASTGGPGAVLEVLRSLPQRYPIPILLVIHIGEPFGVGLADWLNQQSPLGVRCAVDGEMLPRVGEARVLMAPAGRHLALRAGRISLTRDAERHSCRPSVDVLFESLAREVGDKAAACLLTGMGRDGAEGLLAIRRAGGRTIAQDEQSSVVYGMPREAALIGAAGQVLPLRQIGPALTQLAACAAAQDSVR